jgi:hypothetical protein
LAVIVTAHGATHWQIIHPTTSWQRMNTSLGKDDFGAATDLYYINVSKQ